VQLTDHLVRFFVGQADDRSVHFAGCHASVALCERASLPDLELCLLAHYESETLPETITAFDQ
jgi:hypothetical protein